jgi:pimeloyl-ACP methyl ester carboxylesterase
LTNWSTEAELHRIHVPTLVIHGKYDLAQDFVIAPLAERISGAKSVKLENSSHSPQWEQRHKLVSIVHDFLLH